MTERAHCPRCGHRRGSHPMTDVGAWECAISLNEPPSCAECRAMLDSAVHPDAAFPRQASTHRAMGDALHKLLETEVSATDYAKPEPLTMDSIRRCLDEIQRAKPTVVARPESVAALESLPDRHLFRIVESDHVDEGTVYVIGPDTLGSYGAEYFYEFTPLVDPDEAFLRKLMPEAAEWQIRLYLRLLQDGRPVATDDEA